MQAIVMLRCAADLISTHSPGSLPTLCGYGKWCVAVGGLIRGQVWVKGGPPEPSFGGFKSVSAVAPIPGMTVMDLSWKSLDLIGHALTKWWVFSLIVR
jgi:hypothetical protein